MMRIIISPAKKMNIDRDSFPVNNMPPLLPCATILCEAIRKLSYPQAKKLWGCNDRIAELNYKRFADMDLEHNLTPAILAYEGLQYQYMAPGVFTERELEYVQSHVRILSGLYGVVSPLDGIVPYRLEMKAGISVSGKKHLYDFWEDKIYREVAGDDCTIVNLASKEYSQVVERYLTPKQQFVTCVFGEWQDGKIKQKGTLAKMARGEMVRFMAANNVTELEELKVFCFMEFRYIEEYSSKDQMVFVRGTL